MKFLLSILFLCSLSFIGMSQIEIAVSKSNVAVYEKFNLVITIYSGCEIVPTQLQGFELIGEPSVSTQSYSSSINGKKSSHTSTAYTYQIKSVVSGNYKLGPFQAKCDDQILQSNVVSLNVTDTPNKNPDFYTELYASKSEVYPGEAFVLTLKVFLKTKSKTSLERIIPSELSFLQTVDVTPADKDGNIENKYETINGAEYNTAIIRQEVCFLSESGNIIIEPYYTSALIGNGLFNTKRLETYSNIIRITSKTKPSTKLANNFGLTGDYTLGYKLDESALKVGEAIDYTITLNGNGNGQVFDVPQLNIPESFDEFEPELTESLRVNENGFIGEKSYHFTFVPTQPGQFTIPAYSLAYFDLKSKSYKELTTKPMLITVEEGDSAYGAIEHKTINESSDAELRPSHTSTSDTFVESDLLAGSPLHYALTLLPFGILILLLKTKKKKNTRTDDQLVDIKKKKAKKGAKQYLSECKKLHQSGNDAESVRALHLGFKNYLKNKLNLTEHDLTLKHIHSQITDESTKSKFTSCWNALEMYQYSPVSGSAVDSLIEDVEGIINEIDKQI